MYVFTWFDTNTKKTYKAQIATKLATGAVQMEIQIML